MSIHTDEMKRISEGLATSYTAEELDLACLYHLSTSLVQGFAHRNNRNLQRMLDLQKECIKAYIQQHKMNQHVVCNAYQNLTQVGKVVHYLETLPE